jgi:hypothetical protein
MLMVKIITLSIRAGQLLLNQRGFPGNFSMAIATAKMEKVVSSFQPGHSMVKWYS